MTELIDIMKRIEQTPEAELQRIFQHIMQKVEAFANMLRLDQHSANYFKTMLRDAIMLYLMMEENQASKERLNLEDSVSTVHRIKSGNTNKLEESLYLARDISQEYLLATSIKIC